MSPLSALLTCIWIDLVYIFDCHTFFWIYISISIKHGGAWVDWYRITGSEFSFLGKDFDFSATY